MKLINKTFDSDYPPKGMTRFYELVCLFREGFFEFFSLFMLLYVQLASPISHNDSATYSLMFLVITIAMVIIKILAAFCWTFSSQLLEKGKFPLGRYRSMMFIGLSLYTIVFILLFYVAPLFSGWLYVFSFIILYLLLEACYSINDIGYWSFITTLTSDEKRRGEILSWASVFLIASSYFVASIAPAITASNPKENMTILGTILIIFSFVSQLIFVLTMKERKETLPLTQEKSRIDFLQPMKILFSDRQLRLTTLVMFMISLAQFCVIGNSANYFYYEYGYGGFLDSGYQGSMFSGGMVSFIFIICYGLGYLISQICLPPLMKRYSKKKILLFSLIAMTGIYLLMFFFGFSSGNEISLFIMSFCIAFFYGLCYTIVSINTNDGVEYYQYHYHQRKDGTIQSFRAFGVILATAGQTGVFYIFMLLGGLSDINSSIAKAEAEKMSGELAFDSATSFNSYINNEIIHLNDITSSMWVYRSELTILPMLLVVASVLVTVFFVKVNDEKYFDSMVHSIQKQEIQNETI